MLEHIKGKLIDLAEQGKFTIVVHGCNCQNVMGSGIAKEIRERYNSAWVADCMYDDPTQNRIYKLGNYTSSLTSHNFLIINAYTQVHFMPRGIDHFEYESFQIILKKIAATFPTAKVGFPYIGMGLGGGDQDRIIAILEEFAKKITKTGGSATLVKYEQ